MSITSLSFYVFLLSVLVLYYTAARKLRAQWVLLLAASIFFYCMSGWRTLFLVFLTAGSCWGAGLGLQSLDQRLAAYRGAGHSREEKKHFRMRTDRRKRGLLAAALLFNFGILALLKYWRPGGGGLLLPLGISFYTFQAAGYVIDLYYGKYEAERNPLHFLLFLTFFPQLIQGPINRYDKLRGTLLGEHAFSWDRTRRALLLIGFGLLKKFAVADLLAPPIAAVLDGDVSASSGALIAFSILLYSAQQYCDFSGGIDVVLGAAELFGVEMTPNFRQPYFAVSLTDFWQRWHISLGAWMRDYVYYPFALCRPVQSMQKKLAAVGKRRLGAVLAGALGNLLVFFLVGIWHGAELHYILWGLYNGIVIAWETLLAPAAAAFRTRHRIGAQSRGLYLYRLLRTFFIVNIGWYFDRIADWRKAFFCLGRTFAGFLPKEGGAALGESLPVRNVLVVLLALAIVFTVSVLRERRAEPLRRLESLPLVLRWGVYYGLILMIQLSCDLSSGAAPFLYAYF